jgi:hypothetical protein
MKLVLIPLAAFSLALLAGSSATRAQAPPSPNPGVQVSVPQGNAQDQAAAQAQQAQQQAARAKLANQPVPRTADGRIALGNTSTVKGLWIGGGLGFCNANRVTPPASLNPGVGRAGAVGARAGGAAGGRAGGAAGGRAGGRGAAAPCTPVPYMEWTLAVSDDRRVNELEPHTRCKPSGGPHTYRTIFMDGRKHPEKLTPTYYGHSIGWWEGDTLVVDTVGFNEGFWIDRGQLPHTEKLHLIERYTRTALDSMRYELTVDDPGAYTAPFTATSNLRWENGTELFEYVCQQGNEADTLMVGGGTKADRSSAIVP